MVPLMKGLDLLPGQVEPILSTGRIPYLFLAINDRCNLRCPHCFTESGVESKTHIDSKAQDIVKKEELKKAISESKEIGVQSVAIWGEGEPLMEKGLFFELVEHINKEGLTPILYTNGVLIDEGTAERLFKKNVSVIGKLESFDPGKNEFATGGVGLYKYVEFEGKTVPDYIPRLFAAGYKGTNRLSLATVITPKNYDEIEGMWRWERGLGIIPYMQFLTFAGRAKEMDCLDLDEERRKDLDIKIHEIDKELGFEYPLTLNNYVGPRDCDIRAMLLIGAYGNAKACTCIYELYGNIRDTPLRDILKNKQKKDSEMCLGKKSCVYCDAYLYNKAKCGSS